jgi:hypothetical protein
MRLFRMTVSSRYLLLAPLAAALAAPAVAAPAPKPAPAAAKAPAKPVDPVVSLKLEPASLSFADRRDTRRFLVLGVTKGGLQVDLTDSAKIQAAPVVKHTGSGYLDPVKACSGVVAVSAAGKTA